MIDLDAPVDLDWLLSHQDLMLVTRDGLGDHIVAAGLAVWLAQRVRRVYVPGRRVYWPSVNWMFKNVPNIVPIGLEPGSNWSTLEQLSSKINCQLCKANLEYPLRTEEPWFRACYSQYHLNYQSRFDYWPQVDPGPNAESLFNKLVQSLNYIVVHNNSNERSSYDIDLQQCSAQNLQQCQIINIDSAHSNNLFDWLLILERAKEIHLVPSSVFCLCQQLQSVLQGQVFVHDRRSYTGFVYEKDIKPYHPNWRWVSYPFQQ